MITRKTTAKTMPSLDCTRNVQTGKRTCFAGENLGAHFLSPEFSTGFVDRFSLEFGCGSGQRGGESAAWVSGNR
jgi:hypothetical protein